MVGSWEARIVASLRQSRREGLTFSAAWKLATQEVPVPRTNRGTGPARLFVLAGDDPEEIPIVDAMRIYCADAWFGRRPALRFFTLDMLRESDGATAAPRAGHIRQAAA